MLDTPAIDVTKFDPIPEETSWQAPHMAQTLTEQIYVGTLLLNEKYFVVHADKTAELLLGQTTKELMNKDGRDLLGADAFASLELSAGQAHRYTTKLKRIHKAESPATITLVRNFIEEKAYITASIAVINDNHEMQESLHLNQRLASLGMLTASIAHELKNPLSVITNTCDNLSYALADEELNVLGLTRYVNMIRKNAWHCAHLIDALRSYMHKNQHGEHSSLNELVQDSIDLVIPQFQRQRDIQVHVDLGTDVKNLICVPSQITQIIVNLLSNACDATSHKDPGHIWIKTWDVPELDSIAVSVRDNGRGIPEDLMEEIFEPFFTTKRQADGTGLGLFIAAEIVKRHNGWIRVQNQLNENTDVEGVQFTVMLPRK